MATAGAPAPGPAVVGERLLDQLGHAPSHQHADGQGREGYQPLLGRGEVRAGAEDQAVGEPQDRQVCEVEAVAVVAKELQDLGLEAFSLRRAADDAEQEGGAADGDEEGAECAE